MRLNIHRAVVITKAVYIAKAAAERERKRLAGLAEWANCNGFTFSPRDPFDLDERFNGINSIGHGHNRYAFEVLYRAEPLASYVFRYHYRTTETRTVTSTDSKGNTTTRTETHEEDHWHNYLIIELGAAFPSLLLRREHWGDKIAGLLGFDDINFESEAFSRRYFCKGSDRQFAYAVIHPQMMEWLMAQPFECRLEGGRFAMDLSNRKFDAGAVHDTWSAAAGFINRIPDFVWQDYGKRPRVELPGSIRYERPDGVSQQAIRSAPPPR